MDRDVQQLKDALRGQRRSRFASVVLLVGLVTLLVAAVVSWQRAENATDARTVSVALAKDLGEQMAASPVCRSTDPTTVAQFGDLCERAYRVRDEPDPNPVDIQALTAAVAAVVLANLPERVEAAVAEALRRDPPKADVTTDELVAVVTPVVQATVTSYLVMHPPEPGRAPTSEEIRAATRAEVKAWFERNPPPAGPPGPPGPGATDAQVQAAVTSWMAVHPLPGTCPGVWEPALFRDGTAGYRCEVPR